MKKCFDQLGKLVKDHREKAEVSQLELSKKLGYGSAQFVSLIERGVSRVPIVTLGKLIVLLDIPEKKVIKLLIAAYQDEIVSAINEGKEEVS
ncbi:MAG: helix-turn-helix domain-containing protein [Bdellovibrio sp.]|nr:helix-turn-helix domain-containing protein [Bdellovibrio sp.]